MVSCCLLSVGLWDDILQVWGNSGEKLLGGGGKMVGDDELMMMMRWKDLTCAIDIEQQQTLSKCDGNGIS